MLESFIIFSFNHYWISPTFQPWQQQQLRSARIRLDDESRVRTPLRRNLKSIHCYKGHLFWLVKLGIGHLLLLPKAPSKHLSQFKFHYENSLQFFFSINKKSDTESNQGQIVEICRKNLFLSTRLFWGLFVLGNPLLTLFWFLIRKSCKVIGLKYC